MQRRRLNGAISRVPTRLHDLMWAVMQRCTGGIRIAGMHLPQQPTLTDMTEYELTFVLAIERLLDRIVLPEYRQIMLEVCCLLISTETLPFIQLLLTLSTLFARNDELKFQGTLDMDAMIVRAFELFEKERTGIAKTSLGNSFHFFICFREERRHITRLSFTSCASRS